MKKLILITVVCVTSLSTHAQEKYFHDLKGLKDSSDITHLFYRLYEQGNDESFGKVWRDDIFHLNLTSGIDSLKFESCRNNPCGWYGDWTTIRYISDYTFLDDNLQKWFIIEYRDDSYSNRHGFIKAFNTSFFHAGPNYANKIDVFFSDTLSFSVFNFKENSIVSIMREDSLPSINYEYSMLVKAVSHDEQCDANEDGCFLGESDSVLIHNYNFLSLDKHQQGGLFFQRNDSLFWSDDLGKTMTFMSDEFQWSLKDSFLYAEDSSAIIAATRFKFSPLEVVPDTAHYYQLLKSTDSSNSWEEVWGDSSKIYLSQILEGDGLFYFGNGNVIFESTNSGESITEFLTVDYPITGLYKKPDSDLLYVLTTEKLLEVNTETLETTTLKQLPVSSEPEPAEIPKQISLEQNYPNPFNPSTVVSYQLAVNSLVDLEVFDVMGRKVAVLVDGERKPAGSHQVTFDASGLSSGIYFYRLQSAGQTFTHKMMLVK
ncbi:MAG: T9SS type A sorting domain-containing protein [Balneolaceae bacterium]